MRSLGFPTERPPRRIAALAAHADDLEIGCGGTLLQLARQQPRPAVDIVLLTGDDERTAEAEAAARLFLPGCAVAVHHGGLRDGHVPAQWAEAKALLERVRRGADHDLVLAPREDDAHQDHRTLAELVTTVWRDHLVLGYEIPKWDGDLREAAVYVELSPEDLRDKVELLEKAYPSQHGRAWWDEEVFRGLARLRGMQCHARYAEAFTVSKLMIAWGKVT